jgi:hypothetical protein
MCGGLVTSKCVVIIYKVKEKEGNVYVTTLTLGSRPRKRLARLRAKREARESHHMFLEV